VEGQESDKKEAEKEKRKELRQGKAKEENR
jgi:hypothetical protein